MLRKTLLLLAALASLTIANSAKAWFLGEDINPADNPVYGEWATSFPVNSEGEKIPYKYRTVLFRRNGKYAWFGMQFTLLPNNNGHSVAIDHLSLSYRGDWVPGDPSGTPVLSVGRIYTLSMPVCLPDMKAAMDVPNNPRWHATAFN